MRPDDLPAAERLSDETFFELDTRTHAAGRPEPARRSPEERTLWQDRTAHVLGHDPGGCWVADDDGEVVGIAVSLRREVVWVLSTFTVAPGMQGRGIGTPLLAAAAQHGAACTRGMLAASVDARAVRMYHRAGFALHPQMVLSGTVDRSVLPVVEKVRDGSLGDVDLMDSLDRAARGAGHGVDHAQMLSTWRVLVSDSGTGSGYAYLDHRGRLALLAASNRRTATRLLWAVLAEGAAETSVEHLTGANQWALEVGFAARLQLRTQGYLALRGMDPPSPYVHHGALL
jgi:GNAT superfamily N-acetyltransferase